MSWRAEARTRVSTHSCSQTSLLTDINDALLCRHKHASRRWGVQGRCIQGAASAAAHTDLIDVVQRHPISHKIFERDLALQIHVNQLGHTVTRASVVTRTTLEAQGRAHLRAGWGATGGDGLGALAFALRFKFRVQCSGFRCQAVRKRISGSVVLGNKCLRVQGMVYTARHRDQGIVCRV